jgi:hypothetical protein
VELAGVCAAEAVHASGVSNRGTGPISQYYGAADSSLQQGETRRARCQLVPSPRRSPRPSARTWESARQRLFARWETPRQAAPPAVRCEVQSWPPSQQRPLGSLVAVSSRLTPGACATPAPPPSSRQAQRLASSTLALSSRVVCLRVDAGRVEGACGIAAYVVGALAVSLAGSACLDPRHSQQQGQSRIR